MFALTGRKMAKTFNIDSLDSDNITVFATIEQKDYAYSLLESSLYDEIQYEIIDTELSCEDLTIERLDAIVFDLKNNQSDSPNPSMSEIKEQLNNRLLRDND